MNYTLGVWLNQQIHVLKSEYKEDMIWSTLLLYEKDVSLQAEYLDHKMLCCSLL